MRDLIARYRARAADADAYRAGSLRTMAAMGMAASLLFAALTVVAFRSAGDGRSGADDTEVLGAAAGEPSGPSLPAGEYEVASTEGGAFFVHAENPADNVEGSATVIVRGEGEVVLTVGGRVEGDRGVISATVENGTPDVIVFADGLTVTVDVARDGAPWRTFEPADRSITQLAPGESATVSTEVALDAYGQYDLTGEVLFTRG